MTIKPNRFPIPSPIFPTPGTRHALIYVTPASLLATLDIHWVSCDMEIFTSDIRRTINAAINRSPFAKAPPADGPAPCRIFVISVFASAGAFAVEPALARFDREDGPSGAHLIDRLVGQLNSLLKSVSRPIRCGAALLQGRN